MNGEHIPGRLQISTECNQDCLFCSVPKSPVEKPPLEKLKKRVEELKKEGTNDLFITGGEPTIHKNLFDIIDYAEETGFKEITIQSNGSNLTKQFLDKIKHYKNIKFDISFHSFEEEVFNKLSSSTNYKSFLQGLKNLNDSGIKLFLTMVINELNYRKLKEHIIFIRKNFPNITHFSLNFIDPVGRVEENKWIVPTLVDTERYICEAVRYMLENGLTFRLERVPLCYMSGFEEFSTEARLNGLSEKRLTYFAKNTPDSQNLFIEKKKQYIQTEECKACFLKELCPGLNKSYVDIHGSGEIFPVFTQPERIIRKMKESRASLSGKEIRSNKSFDALVREDLALFKEAIRRKPNKNNIYDTYSLFLMHNIGLRERAFIYDAWKEFSNRLKKGLAPNLLSLYIHFPYCQSSCDYCVYPSTKLRTRKQIDEYISYLVSEMESFSELFSHFRFKTLSIGGGTPSLMSENQLRTMFNAIYNNFEFEKDGEKSIEFNPNTTTYEKLKVVEEFDFNKLSIGIQSLSSRVLKENNRDYQTAEKIRKVISDFKKTKIGYINVDLIIGLKGDTPSEFLQSFEEVCKMKPCTISIYPIKTNNDYIEPRYGTLKNFLHFYYPLFREVTKKMLPIARKFGFTPSYTDPNKLSYVHPCDFTLKNQPERMEVYNYSNFKVEPFSNLGLGYYSESCINNIMRYICVSKSNPSTMFLKKFSTKKEDFVYNINLFEQSYDKVKFITHSVYEHFAVLKEEYKKRFGTDITDDFPHAIKALQHLNMISVDEYKISFNLKTERELYPYLLFFVGRENVLKKFKFS